MRCEARASRRPSSSRTRRSTASPRAGGFEGSGHQLPQPQLQPWQTRSTCDESPSLRLRFERHRDAVHAVAQTRRARTVGKYVTEVSATLRAVDLGPRHPVALVRCRADSVLERRSEARPPGAALEFRRRVEQWFAASRAPERARALLTVQRTRPAMLGAVLPQHVELVRGQRLPPFVIVLLHYHPHMTRRLALAFILTAAVAVRAAVTAPPDLDAWIDRAMRTFDVPGLSLAIVKDDGMVVAKGYGVRKMGESARVDE